MIIVSIWVIAFFFHNKAKQLLQKLMKFSEKHQLCPLSQHFDKYS